MSGYFKMLREEMYFPWANDQEVSYVPEERKNEETYNQQKTGGNTTVVEIGSEDSINNYAAPQKKKGLGKYWTVVATGAGLYSDGFINNSVGFFNTMVKQVYGAETFNKSDAMQNISAIVFVGTVVGMIFFGFFADYHSRKLGMIISTGILILFSILLAGSWGVGMPENPQGMFAAITVYRAILGIGIGGEYPAGSVAAAEASQLISHGQRNRWFVLFTNFMIDFGYVAAAFIAWLLLYICGVGHTAESKHGLNTAWRVLFGLGAVAPLTLLYLRLKFEENDQFKRHNLKHAKKIPWVKIMVKYFPRLAVVSLIWFLYDFLSYSWGIYSSQIISIVVPDGDLHKTFGWTTLLNVFYLPGAFLGAFSADYFGPRMTLCVGTTMQGIVGFIMVSQYHTIVKHTGAFVVAYGVFIALGEFGPGDTLGLIASKTAPAAIRGRYYGFAAAVGKIGAFAGGYAFPAIANHYGGLDAFRGQTTLLYVSSALCVFSGLLALLLPSLTQSAVNDEDYKFRDFLVKNGFDVSQMGDDNLFEEIPAHA